MVRKDLQLFFSGRRSVIMSFVVPIAIASFFGSIFSGPGKNAEPARISVAVVDHDLSAISKDVVAGAQADRNLKVSTPTAEAARDQVRRGTTSVAVVIPSGFGDAAGSAFFGDGPKPALEMLYDPSHSVELAMVRGILTEHVMQSVSKQMFGGPQGRVLVDRALQNLGGWHMPADQKKALGDMLSSVQRFYGPTSADGAAAPSAPRASPCRTP